MTTTATTMIDHAVGMAAIDQGIGAGSFTIFIIYPVHAYARMPPGTRLPVARKLRSGGYIQRLLGSQLLLQQQKQSPPLNLRDCLHHSLANTHLATFASWHDYEEEEMPTEDLMSVQKESTMPDGLGG